MKLITEDEFPFNDNPYSSDEFIDKPSYINDDDLRDPELTPFGSDDNLNGYNSEDPLLTN